MALEGCKISVFGSPVPVRMLENGNVECTRPVILDVSKFSEPMETFYDANKDTFGDCTLAFSYDKWLEGEALAEAKKNPSGLASKSACRLSVLAEYGKDAVKGGAKGNKQAQF